MQVMFYHLTGICNAHKHLMEGTKKDKKGQHINKQNKTESEKKKKKHLGWKAFQFS